jgi:dephospho-CoA kinase
VSIPPLVGLTGRKRHGKDTFAARLVEQGWERVAFADAVREMAYDINPRVVIRGMVLWLQDVVDSYGWFDAQSEPEVRLFLQRLGTEGVRKRMPEAWIEIAEDKVVAAQAQGKPVVITDVRFLNEARFVVNVGGFIVWINRPGQQDNDDHASEREMGSFPIIHRKYENDGTVEQLQDKAEGLARFLLQQGGEGA